VPSLQHARDTDVRDQARTILYTEPVKDVRLRRGVGPDLCRRDKGVRREQHLGSKGSQQDRQADSRTGDREANSRVFFQDSKNECQDTLRSRPPPRWKKRLLAA
jgi:hypothetical protein